MESYVVDWLGLIFRWLHLITGIAWIGASFYFIWLDNSLEAPPQWKRDKGIKGDLWAVHGGGIYEVAKYAGAPEAMPQTLHWFKWEAYSTWLTGMALLALLYYVGAESYLIDPRVAELSKWEAIGLGVAFIAGSWLAYMALCASPLARNGLLLAALLLAFGGLIAWGLTKLFSGRGAYIHFGAIIGTIMVGNVFAVIMPGQRRLVGALERGEAVDPRWGERAKLHSTHNTYLTLPLLFIMISNHYPMTYGHTLNWLVLLVIVLITAAARQYFVLRHHHINRPVILGGAVAATAVLAVWLAPRPVAVDAGAPVADLGPRAHAIIRERCASCHAAQPTDDVFTAAPGGVMLESPAQMAQWAPRIKARSIDSHDMPFMNKTGMTDGERQLVAQWIAAGAPRGD
jgi:uncharacterized membrane protein